MFWSTTHEELYLIQGNLAYNIQVYNAVHKIVLEGEVSHIFVLKRTTSFTL